MGLEEICNAEITVLTSYFPTLGDSIAVKEFCRKKMENKNRKAGVIEIIRKKLAKKRKHRKCKTSSSSTEEESSNVASTTSILPRCTPDSKKTQKLIFVGWLCSTGGEKHKQVRLKQGGGTRRLNVNRNATKVDILEASKNIFFKNGTSSKGEINKFHFDLWDFQQNPIDDK